MRTAELERTRTVDFKREKYSNALIDEMLPLWKEHYQEIALYKDIPLSPDLNIYSAAEQKEMLRIFTARDNGKLVGYEVFFIHPHPHYSSALEAVQDALFLSVPMRKGFLGYQFIKWVDSELEHSVARVIFRCVSNMRDYAPLLKRLGYLEHDIVMSRRIK